MNLRLAYWIYKIIGDERGGIPSPPGTKQKLDLKWKDGHEKFYATTYNNDGHELWMGTPIGWWGFLSAMEARKLAKFILWDWWIIGTWFGLKRLIWYKALSTICDSYINRRKE